MGDPTLPPGPLDLASFPEQLTARVVEVGDDGERYVAGFASQGDLACHYPLGGLWYAALCGELPGDEASAFLEVALALWAPASVGEAPTHAALLARLCGSEDSSVAAVGALGLCEELGAENSTQRELWDWLAAGGQGDPPREARLDPEDPDVAASAATATRCEQALRQRGVHLDHGLEGRLRRDALTLVLLHLAGVRSLEAARCLMIAARLPVMMAEALAQRPGAFKEYPMNLPRFVAQGEDSAGEEP